ncbi:hypothetical protein vseg_010374 [Gypsophila vaccaria]
MATSFPSLSQTHLNFTSSTKTPHINNNNNNGLFLRRRRLKSSIFTAKCSVNLPLKPSSPAGRSLSSVLLNDPCSFYDAVSTELCRLSCDLDDAFQRFRLTAASPDASLHRRIAELKEAECRVAVEDALYMIISYKFSEIRVPLVPSLSRCLYNGRLEILPSKDWELESIHSPEILELVREHLSIVLGWKAGSNVSVNWSTTEVRRHHLSQVYMGSVLFGYFLKSASLRLRLEHNLPPNFDNAPCCNWTHPPELGSNVAFGQIVIPEFATLSQVSERLENKDAKLKSYVTGLDRETRSVCAKLKYQEGVELVEKHCGALFGNCCDDKNEVILTSLSSMKRLVLEAVAFGCFLWDAEQFISRIYKLKDN